MKSILIPIVAAIVLGCLVAIGLIWMEFAGVEENFLNYTP